MNKTIYALGFFDGVHIGHAALLEKSRELASENHCRCGAVTFGTHPETLVHHQAPVLLNAPRDRELLLRERFAMDTVVTLPFDEHMRTMPWENFLEMLCRDYEAAGFVCGDDFRFGFKGQGNAALLEEYCRERGIPCAVVPEQGFSAAKPQSSGAGHGDPVSGEAASEIGAAAIAIEAIVRRSIGPGFMFTAAALQRQIP